MNEIKPLTSLRGLAAMAVVLQHFSATAQPLTPQWIPSLVPHGYMAVHFFFYLSGFIMCLTYLESFRTAGTGAFAGFLLKRVARIVPLNAFTLAALMALGLASHALLGGNIFFIDTSLAVDLPANLLMLQGLGIGQNLNPPSWSISTEFAAYMVFPLLVFLVFGAGRIVAFLTFAAALLALGYVSSKMPRFGMGTIDTGDRVIQTFAEFTLGMGSFMLYAYRQRRGQVASDAEAAGLAGLIALFLMIGIDMVVSLLCPFLVVAAALNRGWFARVLSGGVPYFLGVISFSIYLIHEPFRPLGVWLFQAIHPAPASAATALLFALAGSLAVIPFAWLTYIGIERPGRHVVRRWAEALTSRLPPATRRPRSGAPQ